MDKSIPDASTPDAGGTADQPTQTGTDDHSQDQATATADNNDKGGSADAASATDKPEAKADDKTETAPAFDTDLDDWSEKRGYGKLESDKERRLAQDARNNQREFSRINEANKSADTLNKATNTHKPDAKTDDDQGDPLEREVKDLKQKYQDAEAKAERNAFILDSNNGITDEVADVMVKVLEERIEKAGTVAEKQQIYDYLTNPKNLGDWRDIAKNKMATATTTDTTAIEDKARADERAKLAKQSNANGPARNATNTNTTDKSEDAARLERFSKWD